MYPPLFASGDGDGGTGTGIARYPVLLALSGVGVSIRSQVASQALLRTLLMVSCTISGVDVGSALQVDAHKYKSKPADKDYTFGLHGAWVLAPCRDGAHNWCVYI